MSPIPSRRHSDENLLVGQIIPDQSLGSESSQVVTNTLTDRIEGGAMRGSLLFHSFEEFNVGDGQNVYFAEPKANAFK